jgi:iron complex outermembrane recepter protein
VETGVTAATARLRAALTGYGMWFRDEIVASGGLDQFGVPRTGNAARTRHSGVEVELTVRLAPGLTFDGTATASDDRYLRFTEFGTDAGGETTSGRRDGNRIALFPSWSAAGALRYEAQRYGARFDFQGVGRTPVTNFGTDDATLTVDPYGLLNATLWARLPVRRGDLRLHLDVNNVLDERVLLSGNSGGFFPAAERHVFVGLRFTTR